MDRSSAAEIDRVDHAISMLNEHRHNSADPVDIIHTGEKIDQWLDRRLAFMADGNASVSVRRSRKRQETA